MKIWSIRRACLLASVPTLALAGVAANAHHSWSTYAWNFDGVNPIDAVVVNNTDSQWEGYVETAVADWNGFAVIAAPLTYGSNTSCSMSSGTIQVCNDNYGSNGC